MHPLLRSLTEEERRESWPDTTCIYKAMMLAPTLEICEALLRGEHVPVEKLDPVWVARFGVKDAA